MRIWDFFAASGPWSTNGYGEVKRFIFQNRCSKFIQLLDANLMPFSGFNCCF